MPLTRAEVETIARLARLRLPSEELDRYAGELGRVLDFIAELSRLDTEGVEPLTHALPTDLRLRPDEAGPAFSSEVALAAAPQVEADCFRVPAVIKTRGR